jgi:hypothetical protein
VVEMGDNFDSIVTRKESRDNCAFEFQAESLIYFNLMHRIRLIKYKYRLSTVSAGLKTTKTYNDIDRDRLQQKCVVPTSEKQFKNNHKTPMLK